MTEHRHEWHLGNRLWVDDSPEIACCMVEGCNEQLSQREIERRLNNYERLKAERDALVRYAKEFMRCVYEMRDVSTDGEIIEAYNNLHATIYGDVRSDDV